MRANSIAAPVSTCDNFSQPLILVTCQCVLSQPDSQIIYAYKLMGLMKKLNVHMNINAIKQVLVRTQKLHVHFRAKN